MKDGVSILMPAYNEAKNLDVAIRSVIRSMEKCRAAFEILVIDDGSRDTTGVIAEAFARTDMRVRVFRNKQNRGFGFSFRRGLAHASKLYVCIFPSDNEMSVLSFAKMIDARTSADFISTFNGNPGKRTRARQFISKLFVIVMNILSGARLRYHTGPFICQTALIKGLSLVSDGVAVLAELRAKAFAQKNLTVKEVPFEFVQRKHGRSTALSPKNVRQTANTILNLILFRLRLVD